jgi:hypothetical protein
LVAKGKCIGKNLGAQFATCMREAPSYAHTPRRGKVANFFLDMGRIAATNLKFKIQN